MSSVPAIPVSVSERASVDVAPGRTMAPAIEAVGLRKEFRKRERKGRTFQTRRVVALEPTTLHVERGECIAILGPNGSGKSTLVRLLSTLLLPDGGSARILGHDLRTE